MSQVLGHREFVLRRLGQGNADGIAYSFFQQGGNGHAALDAAAVAVAGLGNAHMQGKNHPAFLHHAGQVAIGIHHHHGVGCLEGDHDIVETRLNAHFNPFHGSQGHGLGRIAVFLHDILAQGTMIKADADGAVILLAKAQELAEKGPRLLMIGMEVAGVDADLFHHRHHGHGNLRGEVDIGHQGNIDAIGPETASNLFQMLYIGHGRHGDADELGSGGCQQLALRHGSFYVGSMGVAHGLDHDGVAAADEHVFAYANGTGFQNLFHTTASVAADRPSSCAPVSSVGRGYGHIGGSVDNTRQR